MSQEEMEKKFREAVLAASTVLVTAHSGFSNVVVTGIDNKKAFEFRSRDENDVLQGRYTQICREVFSADHRWRCMPATSGAGFVMVRTL